MTGKNQPRPVRLEEVVDIKDSQDGIPELNRINMRRVINIYLNSQDRDIGGVADDAQKIIQKTHFKEGYSALIKGEITEMNDALRSLSEGFLLAALLVYLVLVAQFRSFIYPALMMVTVPLGLVGSVLLFYITKTYISLQAAIGAIFMIGIAVSNGVLLVEFILHQLQVEKLPLDEAILKGASARLRPVLMTSLASILGLMPMALGLGLGSEANIPLGRAVVGGQLFSVILTLFVLPTLFRFVQISRASKQKVNS